MTRRDKILYFLQLHRTGLSICLLAALLLVFPVWAGNPYLLGISNLIAVYLIAVIGLNLFIGYAGQISLGHAAYLGLGAYGSALLTVNFELNPWLAMVVVAFGVALASFLVAIPTLRLKGHYLAMATLGFNIVCYTVMMQWDQVTGGPSGLAGIPSLAVAGIPVDDEIRFHYLVWTIAVIVLTLGLNLVRSSLGLALAAVAQNESAAESLGIQVSRAKIRVFVLSAVLASLAGSLFAHCFTFINPDSFTIFNSIEMVTMVVIGGLGSIWGSLFGTALIVLLPEFLHFFDTFRDIIHGLIVVTVLILLPQGLVSGLRDLVRVRSLMKRKHAPN
ncbi:MAG: branched-chain amino acid ABC transporter permease [Deltaproteobacteria bacterium]|nr:branched-chain amino acid ABC transporter permease [Deltaproteobacteria bacterium]